MDTTSVSNLSEEAESAIDFSTGQSLGPTVSLYGNLSTERKKDIQSTRVAHVRFSRLTLLGDGEPRNLVFAVRAFASLLPPSVPRNILYSSSITSSSFLISIC